MMKLYVLTGRLGSPGLSLSPLVQPSNKTREYLDSLFLTDGHIIYNSLIVSDKVSYIVSPIGEGIDMSYIHNKSTYLPR